MAKTTWCAGRSLSGALPVWAPLLAVVGSLTGGFMWMYEVVLQDDRRLHAYKHRETHSYLHLDTDHNAWAYAHRQGRSMYRTVDLADALTEVFAGWDGLACGPSPEELALIAEVIDAARNPASSPPPTSMETVAVEIDVTLMERARARVPQKCSLTDRATAEHALTCYALDRELLHGGCASPLTAADASCLLLDELHQTGRVQQAAIDSKRDGR